MKKIKMLAVLSFLAVLSYGVSSCVNPSGPTGGGGTGTGDTVTRGKKTPPDTANHHRKPPPDTATHNKKPPPPDSTNTPPDTVIKPPPPPPPPPPPDSGKGGGLDSGAVDSLIKGRTHINGVRN